MLGVIPSGAVFTGIPGYDRLEGVTGVFRTVGTADTGVQPASAVPRDFVIFPNCRRYKAIGDVNGNPHGGVGGGTSLP